MDRSHGRGLRCTAVLTLLFWGVLACPSQAAPRSVIFLFGPQGTEPARRSALAAAANARRWLKQPESNAELRRTGSPETLALAPQTQPKTVDGMFLDAARGGRDSDLSSLLASLDAASQSLARRAGQRFLVLAVEMPPLSTEVDEPLQRIIDFCQENAIRVVVLDSGEPPAKGNRAPLQQLAERSGGALIRDPKALDIEPLSRGVEAAAGQASPAPVEAAQLPPLPSGLPVYTRFVRISSQGVQRFGTERHFEGGRGGISETDGGATTEKTTGPVRGYLLVESPLNALQFDVDDNAGTYQARARVTQLVRDASGKIAWQAGKLVVVKGPLKKLDSRRAGNLYFLREVQLPAGRYTLEATVEDLIAGKSGGIREPLGTSPAVPGFDVSDALIVRPFQGAADRFEADQVLSYNGDAVAPLLDPVYRANEPFDLRVFVVIYPDLHGGQPELSLEILRNGRVVGRSALPFIERVHNDAIEGRGTSIVGEQKRQFPYLATIRGAKLAPGDFEARFTVRQMGHVLVRTAKFRVVGDAAPASPASASAPQEVGGAPAEDDMTGVVLPEVDPVDLDRAANVLSAVEQQRLWEEAASSALSYSSHLPNFRCHRETHRLVAPVRHADQFRQEDTLLEELIYENGGERYRTLEVNGVKSTAPRAGMQGVHSRGEFGSMLKSIFAPEISAGHRWVGRAMAGGALCDVFEIEVPANKSNLVLNFNLAQVLTAYQGRVFIDPETGLVRRIVAQGSGVPKDFGLQSPVFSLEYGMVRIADQDHLLPLRSVLQVRQNRRVIRNETVFRDYRKFEAESEIRFQSQSARPPGSK